MAHTNKYEDKKKCRFPIIKRLFWWKSNTEIIGTILTLFYLPFFKLYVRLLRYFVRSDGERIIVGCSNRFFTDQPRALFEWMTGQEDRFDCYWFANSIWTSRYVRKRGGRAYFKFSPFGATRFLRTQVWIVSYLDIYNQKKFTGDRAKYIVIWHGMGPKAIDLSPKQYENFDAWCVPSEYNKEGRVKFGAPPEIFHVTGWPRSDRLRAYLRKNEAKLREELGIKVDARILLYAPTFGTGLWPWGDQYEGFTRFCGFCEKRGVDIILRLHPVVRYRPNNVVNIKKLRRILRKFPNVHWLDMVVEPDTEKVLAVTDLLVTDWSSIYVDFLQKGGPIVFMEVRKNYFTNERGSPEVPAEMRPGEIVKHEIGFFKALDRVLENGNRFEDEQRRISSLLLGNPDGGSFERVAKVIEDMVGRAEK